MHILSKGLTALSLSSLVLGKVYFKETFDDDSWKARWIQNNSKGYGSFDVKSGIFGSNPENKGLKTENDNSFYGISAPLDENFQTKDKTLVLQYSAKLEQDAKCSSNYIKLFPRNLKQGTLNMHSDYNILFGPNNCKSFNQTQAILNYKNKKTLLKKQVNVDLDHLTHVYTFVVKPDQTYQILVDYEERAQGKFFEDWDFLEPKMIPDPKIKKPEDWVDDEFIDDPNDKRPEGLDVIPQYIPDPKAEKPSDWDDVENGMWEAPKIENPEYQEWYPRTIRNPAYMGKWIQPMIENPDYYEDFEIYIQEHAYVGFEFYQVNAGTLFDNIIITDNLEEAQAFAKETEIEKEKEKELYEKYLIDQEIIRKQRILDEAKKAEEDYAFKNYDEDDLKFLEDESDEEKEDSSSSEEEENSDDDDGDDDGDDDDEFVIYDDKPKKTEQPKKDEL